MRRANIYLNKSGMVTGNSDIK